MNEPSPLDNAIWHALTTAHRSLARPNGRASRYPSDMSPLAGLAAPTPGAFAELRELVGSTESVAMFTAEPMDVPDDWEVKRARSMHQMIYADCPEAPAVAPVRLGPADVPEMLALTALAQPGPFLPRTIEMGDYFGIRAGDGRLVAMAGGRLNLAGFTEISAVCTHPDFRGRGHGQAVVRFVAHRIFQVGKIPFLHVVPENPALKMYEKVGLRIRRDMSLTVIARR